MFSDSTNIRSPSKLSYLKEEYDYRLQSFLSQLKVFFEDLFKDEIFQAMRENPLNKDFAVQRACEVFEEVMNAEKEQLIERLQDEIVSLRMRSEEDKTYIKSQFRDIENHFQPLAIENERLKSELQKSEYQLQDQLTIHKQSSEDLSLEVEKLRNQLHEEIINNNDLKDKFKTLTEESKLKISRLKKKIIEQRQKIMSLNEDIKKNTDKHHREIGQIQHDFDRQLQEIQGKSQDIANKYTENEENIKRNHTRFIDNLNQEHQEVLGRLNHDLQIAKDSEAEIKKFLHGKLKEIEEDYMLKETHDIILNEKEETNQRQKEILQIQLNDTAERLKEEKEKYTKLSETYTHNSEVLTNEKNRYYDQIQNLKQELIERESEITSLHSEINYQKTEIEGERSEIEKLNIFLSQREEEVNNCQIMLRNTQKELKNEKERTENERIETHKYIENLQVEHKNRTESAFKKAEEDRNQADSIVKDMKSHIDKLEHEIKIKEKSLAGLSDQHSETEYQLSNLKEVLKARDKFISEASSSLKSTQNELFSEKLSKNSLKQRVQSILKIELKTLRVDLADLKELLEHETLTFNMTLRKFLQDFSSLDRLNIQNWQDKFGQIEQALKYDDPSLLNRTVSISPAVNDFLAHKRTLKSEIDEFKNKNKNLKENNHALTEKNQKLAQELKNFHENLIQIQNNASDEIERIRSNNDHAIRESAYMVETKYKKEIDTLNTIISDMQWQLKHRERNPENFKIQLDSQERHIAALKEKYYTDIQTLDLRIEELEHALDREREQKEEIAKMRIEDINELNQQLEIYKRRYPF